MRGFSGRQRPVNRCALKTIIWNIILSSTHYRRSSSDKSETIRRDVTIHQIYHLRRLIFQYDFHFFNYQKTANNASDKSLKNLILLFL